MTSRHNGKPKRKRREGGTSLDGAAVIINSVNDAFSAQTRLTDIAKSERVNQSDSGYPLTSLRHFTMLVKFTIHHINDIAMKPGLSYTTE